MKFNLSFKTQDENKETKAYKNLLKEYESKEIGYYHLPETSQKFLDIDFSDIDYEEVLVIGIGGSSLGTKTVYKMAIEYNPKPMIFLENPDPIDITSKLQSIKKPLIFVISKSGRTIETLSIFKEVINHFSLKPKAKNIKIITDKNSPLDSFAKEWELESFHIPQNVGGRFSVLSAVGVVPLLACGIHPKELLQGAKEFRDNFFEKKEWHLCKKASFYVNNNKDYPINVLFAYSSILKEFTHWYVQLFGESLGKDGKEIMPVGHIGSIDQHSFLQLLMQGMGKKTITFLKINDFKNYLTIPDIKLPHLEATDYVNSHKFEELINKECEATKEALNSTNKYFIDEISIENLNLKTTGKLIMYYEMLTSAIGSLLEINTYNQPGVELGKTILKNKF